MELDLAVPVREGLPWAVAGMVASCHVWGAYSPRKSGLIRYGGTVRAAETVPKPP